SFPSSRWYALLIIVCLHLEPGVYWLNSSTTIYIVVKENSLFVRADRSWIKCSKTRLHRKIFILDHFKMEKEGMKNDISVLTVDSRMLIKIWAV
ncbi:hypothetical protein M8C21_017173, partial [Ambrosia artemisiifolia]